MRKAGAHTSTMPEASIYASNEPKSYSWYDLGDCRDSHNKHALRVYYGWIFLRLFIYVMVVSATVRYGTSMSHISLPQTSVSVDSWVAKKKSKNYHNWTSSASHDVCAAPIFTYIMSGCGLIYEKWMCVKSEGRGMRAELCVKRTIPPCFVPLDLIEYSVLNYVETQTNISYRQSCILCEMHLKFDCDIS